MSSEMRFVLRAAGVRCVEPVVPSHITSQSPNPIVAGITGSASPPAPVTRWRLLGVFAHPDDESFAAGGTLARYARSGAEVHVCTVTDGASGSSDERVLGDSGASSLAELRRKELECACRVLSAVPWTLDYRDSGMEGSPDNQHPDSLYQARLEDVALDLARIIRRTRPHVIITHEATGGYHHPDHVRVSHAVRRAWELAPDASLAPPSSMNGLDLWQPARLYYLVVPRSAIRWFIVSLLLRGKDPRRFGNNGDIDATRLGTPDRSIHVRLDLRAYLPIKEEASACHRSQAGGAHWPTFLGRRAMAHEHLIQTLPPGAGRHSDLFEGLEGVP